jgi:hypothetical protein
MPADQNQSPRSIVGTWRLVDSNAHDADGKPLPKPYGPKGMGMVTLTAEGRMMAVLCNGLPSLGKGVPREYASYCGNYTFDGATLTTRVDASGLSRIAVGADQVRGVRFEGERMILTPPPLPQKDFLQHRELHWERISMTTA